MKKLMLLLLVFVFMISFVSADNVEWNDGNVDNDDTGVGGANWGAQGFTIGTAGADQDWNATTIAIKAYNGDPSEFVTVSIQHVTGNVPNGTVIYRGNVNASVFSGGSPGSWGNVTMFVQSGMISTLEASTKYAIVVNSSATIQWRSENPLVSNYLGGWFCTSSNSGGSWGAGCSSETNRDWTFQLSGNTDPATVEGGTISMANTLIAPPDVTAIVSNMTNFSMSTTISGTDANLTNHTLYIWNSTGLVNDTVTATVTGLTNITNLTGVTNLFIGKAYIWNVLACATNSSGLLCEYADANRTFDFGFKLNSNTFSTPVATLSTQNFILNISAIAGLDSITADLFYNKTLFPSTRQTIAGNEIFTATITIPQTTSTVTKDFNWSVNLVQSGVTTRVNTTTASQVISPVGIDDCSNQDLIILNYTLKDEETQAFLTPSASLNTTIDTEVILRSLTDTDTQIIFNQTFSNTNPATICINSTVLSNSNFRMDTQTRYVSDTRAVEYHHIQNYTLNTTRASQNISLHDLLTTDSQEFLITYKDENFLPVQGALIDITRKYVGEATFKSVEIPKTDSDGQTVSHLVLSDVIYTMNIYKEGKLLATFPDITAFCADQSKGDCTINLNAFTTGYQPRDFDTAFGISYTMNFSKASRLITASFSTLDGSSSVVSLNATKFDHLGNSTVCSSQLTTSSGTLLCTIPESFGNATVIAELFADGQLVERNYYSLQQSADEVFGGTRIVMIIIMFMMIPLMFISSAIGMVIGAMIALALAIALNLTDGGTLVGETTAIIWFLVAGAILIWRISSRE